MSELFTSVLSADADFSAFFLCCGVALLCGVPIAAAMTFRTKSSRSFLSSLLLLPPAVCAVVFVVNGNVGTGVAVMGAFSLIRFRSVAGSAREITALFLSMAAALTAAAGYLLPAFLFSLLSGLCLFLSGFLPAGSSAEKELRVTVPESLSFDGAFDDLFAAYTDKAELTDVRTSGMGTLYKLRYRVRLKKTVAAKDFLDALRTRNANLEIALSAVPEKEEL